MILIKFISASNIPNDFSIESNKFRLLNGPLDLLSGPKNGLKTVSVVKKGGSRSMI